MSIRFIIAIIATSFFISLTAKAQINTIKIWQGDIPGAITNPAYTEVIGKGQRILRVTDPTLEVFMPTKEKANGTAIIICPGGGYALLAFDHEGYKVANWLTELGITAFILKYRLPSDIIMEDKSIGPLQDAQKAMRIVRRDAKKWNIKPNKIGIMGFSAGGHLASTLSTHYNDNVYTPVDTISAHPDFSILVYPVVSMNPKITHKGSKNNLLGENPNEEMLKRFSNELMVNENTPPAFLVHAADDKAVPVENSINYFLALKKNNIPAELHIYEKGGHGFGLIPSKNTESSWTKACELWLRMNKLL